MKANKFLNWRRWSAVMKVQVTAAIAGAVITFTFPLLAPFYGEGQYSFLLLYASGYILTPASAISYILGFGLWEIDVGVGPTCAQLTLAALTNALLLGLIGCFLGWVARKVSKRKKNHLNP